MLLGMKVIVGLATIYWPNQNCGDTLANGEKFTANDAHVAHRWVKLGTRGVICNKRTKLCAETIVKDRGPFGQLLPCAKAQNIVLPRRAIKIKWRRRCYYWVGKTKLLKGWKWRGKFDLAPALAKKLKHRSFDAVSFTYEGGDDSSI